jgi:hypothetical protein
MRMRDGEEFFAKGRATRSFELLREQIKKAGLWHRGLRDDLLAQLALLDRDATAQLRRRSTATASRSAASSRAAPARRSARRSGWCAAAAAATA